LQQTLLICTFQGQETANLVFAVNTQGLQAQMLQPAAFNENVMIEINIDNTGDFVEDCNTSSEKEEMNVLLWAICPSSTGTSV
jgi:hypothetical protein